jgi:hypothetical protein
MYNQLKINVMNEVSNIYQENGFSNRYEYLSDLADQYGLSMYVVGAISEMVGECEDFDALPTTLDDYLFMFA